MEFPTSVNNERATAIQRPLQIYRLHEIGKCNVVTGTKQEIQLLLLTVAKLLYLFVQQRKLELGQKNINRIAGIELIINSWKTLIKKVS